MKAYIKEDGFTHIMQEKEGNDFTLWPAHKWIEHQLATQEIELAFKLIAEIREQVPDDDRFLLSVRYLFHQIRDKHGRQYGKLIEDYINSPACGRLIANLEILSLIEG